MLKLKNARVLIGVGVLLVPSMAFAKTSATVTAEVVELKTNTNLKMAFERAYKGDKLEVVGLVDDEKESGKWYEVVINEDTAFVEQEHLVITDTKGVANVDNLNIRSYPDVNHSQVVGKLQTGDQVRLVYKVGNFYKVQVNDTYGFVYAEYIDSTYGEFMKQHDIKEVRDVVTGKNQEDVAEKKEEANAKGKAIVAEAKKYLGNPYLYGGTSLTKGTDCSGFTQGVMRIMGISIPRTSKAQSQTGKLISKSNLQEGDLLFFGNSSSSIFHTGIYIGNGKMIHASTSTKGIIIADAYTGGGAPLQVIRRVI